MNMYKHNKIIKTLQKLDTFIYISFFYHFILDLTETEP